MKKPIFLLILIPAIIFILIVSFAIIFRPASPQPGTLPILPTPTPVKVNTSIPTLPPENNMKPIEKYDLVTKLPYSTPEFDIEYLTTSDTFIITIKQSPLEENKQKALQWFVQNGADPAGLRILYNHYRWVQ